VNTDPTYRPPQPRRPGPPKRDLGNCQWIVDLKGPVKCGKPGVDEIKVESPMQPALIVVCLNHKAENNQKFAERRNKNKKH